MRTCYRSHTSVCGALTVVFGVLIMALIVNLKRYVLNVQRCHNWWLLKWGSRACFRLGREAKQFGFGFCTCTHLPHGPD